MPYFLQRTALWLLGVISICFNFSLFCLKVFSFAVSAVSRVLIPTKPTYASYLRRNINVARPSLLSYATAASVQLVHVLPQKREFTVDSTYKPALMRSSLQGAFKKLPTKQES